jgi:hypothetical protein
LACGGATCVRRSDTWLMSRTGPATRNARLWTVCRISSRLGPGSRRQGGIGDSDLISPPRSVRGLQQNARSGNKGSWKSLGATGSQTTGRDRFPEARSALASMLFTLARGADLSLRPGFSRLAGLKRYLQKSAMSAFRASSKTATSHFVWLAEGAQPKSRGKPVWQRILQVPLKSAPPKQNLTGTTMVLLHMACVRPKG